MRKALADNAVIIIKGIFLSLCLWSYWPYLYAAGRKGASNGDYSHVIAIPLIALVVYLRSSKNDDIAAGESYRKTGIILVTLGILLRIAGQLQVLPLVAEASFPFIFIGLTGLMFGKKEAVRIIFPAIFLLFSFGFVTDILLKLFVKYLIMMSTGAAYDAVTTFLPQMGPYILTDNTISIPPHIRFDIVEACSGVRALLALYVIGSLVAYLKKLTWRPALRFLLLISIFSVVANTIRICATIVSSLALHDRVSHHFLHEFWNYALFGSLILLTPAIANLAQRIRLHLGLISTLAFIMITVHAVQWHMRAAQGNVTVVMHQTPPRIKPQITLAVDEHSVPKAFLLYVSPYAGGKKYYRWIITSAFVHSNIIHLLVNVGLLLLFGHVLQHDVKWYWMAGIMVAGQITGVLIGWLIWSSEHPDTEVIFMGASCAVSTLFGMYVVLNLLASKKIGEALLFLAIYATGLFMTARSVSDSYGFSFTSHLTGLVVGLVLTSIWLWLDRMQLRSLAVRKNERETKSQSNLSR